MYKDKVIRCYECGEELQDTMYDIGNDDYICRDCRDAYYVECDHCGRLIPEGDLIAVDNNDRFVCDDCIGEFYTCDHCGGSFSDCYLAVNTIQLTLCDHCYGYHYFTCEGCGDVYHTDEGEYIDGYNYCSTCADDHRDCILSYSYKPNPMFFGNKKSGYGIELEIDDGDYRREAAADIQAAGGDHIYLKDDGSLSYAGFEIVTHPATIEYHINHFPWGDICEAALSYGYKSHDTDTCGLHIHASRSLFGDTEMERDLTIAKVILLIDRWYDNYIVKFARRDLSKMQHWAGKPNADIQPEDDDHAAVNKSKKTANSRYKAVNLCNYKTVEFRFFRGTLKRDTIIASIQWVDVIIRYCRNTPLKDLFDTTWDNIFSNTGHAELTNYLKQRNLYNIKGEN